MPDAREFNNTNGLMSVCPKGNPGFKMLVSTKDYDPSIHDIFDESKVPAASETPVVATRTRLKPKPDASTFGTQTKEQLLVMTVDALTKLPEYAWLDAPATKKAAIVDQIIAVREAQPPKE